MGLAGIVRTIGINEISEPKESPFQLAEERVEKGREVEIVLRMRRHCRLPLPNDVCSLSPSLSLSQDGVKFSLPQLRL